MGMTTPREVRMRGDDRDEQDAVRFLDRWGTKVLRSRVPPMRKVARMLRAHRPLLMNWFGAKGALSAAVGEGVNNNKARVTTRIAYGVRTYRAMEIALYRIPGVFTRAGSS